MADRTENEIRSFIASLQDDLPFMTKKVQKKTKKGIGFIEWVLAEIGLGED